MLIVNDKIVDLKATSGEFASYAKDFREKMGAYRAKYGDVIRFLRKNAYKRNASGLTEPVVPWTISFKQTAVGKNGDTETWKYAKGTPRKKDGQYILTQPSHLMMADWNVSLLTDADLAYFVISKTQEFKNGTIYIDDPAAVARKQAAEKRREVELNNVLYGEMSPLADDDTLQAVAASWGVSNTDKKDPNVVRLELEALIRSREKEKNKDPNVKGVKEFLASLGNVKEEIRRRHLIKWGEDHHIIHYNGSSLYYELTATGDRLVYIPVNKLKGRFEYFCDQVLQDRNAKMWDELKHNLITQEYLDTIKKVDDIKWLCKESGIKYVGVKFQDLKQQISEIYAG